ncbi:hypothetical protein DES53_107327 [Roseimicrobium gellanilyticum]|uniref:SMI1/KNR4 family protein SUKH-1 n=1 Tax=Roseimicrobium gellanilyticum TaxID=748857 RepID=A0A366HG02_9BACT|nr:hypothetical protein [Roseimicrobium gellanilyticum]RBP41494.1 hypothetical protein DES53_107327 [Roseimicrobium gellanilyticum]
MKTLTQIFSELRETMAVVSTELASSFAPGIPAEEAKQLLTKIQFTPGEELLELYSLANGSSGAIPLVEILPGAYFQSLEYAINTFENTTPITECWGPLASSLVVLTDHGGSGYGVRPKTDGGRVVNLGIHEPPSIEFNSLAEMLELSLLCYREGVFTWADGMTDADFQKYSELDEEFKRSLGRSKP